MTNLKTDNKIFSLHPKNIIWLSVSEAASLGGVGGKTIRRAIKDVESGLTFKIVKNRYQIELGSLISYLHRNTKLKNKFWKYGLGQYIAREKKGN